MTKKLIIAVLIAAAVATTIGLACSCTPIPAAPDDAINSSKELQTTVTRHVHNWLAPRVAAYEHAYDIILLGEYALVTSVQELEAYFRTAMPDEVIWDMRKLIYQIRQTQLYEDELPTEQQFLAMLIKAIDTFEPYDEEDEDQD